MVSSPVQNIGDFLKNRPPLVLFLFCLVALAVSTFYFAFEIEKDGPTIDSNKEHDWMKMLKHFNMLDYCVNSSSWTNEILVREEEEQFKTEVSVLTSVTVEDNNMLKPYSAVYGSLTLDGWYSTTCDDSTIQPKQVGIFFDVPLTNLVTNGSIDICVTIKGPAEFLPKLKEPLCKPAESTKITGAKAVKGYISSKLPRIVDPKFCKKEHVIKLSFDLTQPGIMNYLSDDIRIQIYMHLMWFSYFVVFIIFVILLYFLIKKSDYLDKKEQSERFL
ncbi:transmembrane protein 248-like [Anthonomus grandis grandis]|uniref:transmembrane protein 248-like n=1 Tax=Anthonomus grandis grandis TaxID=2921223 RepID=UPI002165B01D|nr:transmembrane protein 248-like [Anthonomus grandis grandis]